MKLDFELQLVDNVWEEYLLDNGALDELAAESKSLTGLVSEVERVKELKDRRMLAYSIVFGYGDSKYKTYIRIGKEIDKIVAFIHEYIESLISLSIYEHTGLLLPDSLSHFITLISTEEVYGNKINSYLVDEDLRKLYMEKE